MMKTNGRLKLLSTEESHTAGNSDAESLLTAFRNASENDDAACLLADAMNGIMALAFENRVEESIERLDGFCAVIGPVLERAAALDAKCASLAASLNRADQINMTTHTEQRAVNAAIATCSRVSAGRIAAANQDDEDAIATLRGLQLAVRALEPQFTESEGGEL